MAEQLTIPTRVGCPEAGATEAPSDEAAGQAWAEIMRIASAHALIVQSYGGVATLAMPEDQRTAGIRDRALRMVRMWEDGRWGSAPSCSAEVTR